MHFCIFFCIFYLCICIYVLYIYFIYVYFVYLFLGHDEHVCEQNMSDGAEEPHSSVTDRRHGAPPGHRQSCLRSMCEQSVAEASPGSYISTYIYIYIYIDICRYIYIDICRYIYIYIYIYLYIYIYIYLYIYIYRYM